MYSAIAGFDADAFRQAWQGNKTFQVYQMTKNAYAVLPPWREGVRLHYFGIIYRTRSSPRAMLRTATHPDRRVGRYCVHRGNWIPMTGMDPGEMYQLTQLVQTTLRDTSKFSPGRKQNNFLFNTPEEVK